VNERVVSLSDRGRALEWLSLGFGLWLVASLIAAYLASDIAIVEFADGTAATSGLEPGVAVASAGAHLAAIAALALGAGLLFRRGKRLWFGTALVSLGVLAIERIWSAWVIGLGPDPSGDLRYHLSTIWILGSVAHIVLVVAVVQGLRELTVDQGAEIPPYVIGLAIGVELVRVAASTALPLTALRSGPADPWANAAMAAATSAGFSVAVIGLILVAIRTASAAVRAQIWAGQPGASSPARAADWQRTASGLDRAGAFLIGKIAIAAAATPLLLIGLLTGTEALLGQFVVPFASAVFSAGMVTGLLACRRVPDPPDARAGFTGAALLVAACLAGELYALSARAGEPLAEAVSALGHLVAYLALLRSIGRIGERLGDDDVTRRARVLALIAVPAVGGGTIAGYLLVHHMDDLGVAIATPIVAAALAFAALLPAALLARQLATRLRERFAEPPRARVHSRDRGGA
jgi:hypothetical protein